MTEELKADTPDPEERERKVTLRPFKGIGTDGSIMRGEPQVVTPSEAGFSMRRLAANARLSRTEAQGARTPLKNEEEQ